MPVWIKAGVDWHQGEFKTFFQRVKSTLAPAQQRQGQTWWWMAYEQAQLAQVRLHQQHTAEAMLHSFRAVEGAIWEWLLAHYGDYIEQPPRRYPQLLVSICDRYPSLRPAFVDRATGQLRASVNLSRDLFLAWGADIRHGEDWQKRIINCLNLITSQCFRSLEQANLFSFLHGQAQQAINTYEP